MKLSPAEAELIELVRRAAPFVVMITLPEAGGEWVVSSCVPPPPAGNPKAGIAFTFEEAWRTRVDPTTLRLV